MNRIGKRLIEAMVVVKVEKIGVKSYEQAEYYGIGMISIRCVASLLAHLKFNCGGPY